MTRPGRRQVLVGRRGSRPSRRGRSPRRPRRAGSTPSRPARRARNVDGLSRMTSRSHVPRTRVASLDGRARRVRPRRRSRRKSGSAQVVAAAGRRWRAGWRSSADRPAGAMARGSRVAAGRRRRTARRAGTSAATPPAGPGARVARTSESGTWCDRQVPSVCLPSTTFGPVQPFGVRSTIIGQVGRSVPTRPRAAALIAATSSMTASIVSAISAWTVIGSSPATNRGA